MIAPGRSHTDADTGWRISATIAACARAVDEDHLESWPTYFTEEAVYSIVPRENLDAGYPIAIMYCRGMGMLLDRVLAIRKASVYGPHRYRHILSTSIVTGGDDGPLNAVTSFHVVRTKLDAIERGIADTYAVGEYRDTFVEIAGDWKLSARTVALDTSLVQTLMVLPL